MRDLIMLLIGIFIGIVYLSNQITFEEKCNLSCRLSLYFRG